MAGFWHVGTFIGMLACWHVKWEVGILSGLWNSGTLNVNHAGMQPCWHVDHVGTQTRMARDLENSFWTTCNQCFHQREVSYKVCFVVNELSWNEQTRRNAILKLFFIKDNVNAQSAQHHLFTSLKCSVLDVARQRAKFGIAGTLEAVVRRCSST